uniref:Uncharacterized protein n=1 Tax=viral metagenome TaxID=1070528 RepID=A0A6C0ES24_9ZZZZ
MIGFFEEFFYVMHILIFQYLSVLANYSANQVLALFDTDTEKVGIKLFLLVSKKYSELKYGTLNVYEKNRTIKLAVDTIYKVSVEIYKKLNGVKSEPFSPLWISVFTLTPNLNNNEEYTVVENSVNEVLLKKLKSVMEENASENTNVDKLYTFKTPAYILCNVTNKFEKDDAKYFVEKSDVKFLSIEYSNPDMKEAIRFTLNKDLFQIGNEILSNAFVLRYLQYQSEHYVYANDYTITIIDDKVNQFTLTSKQYLLLEKNEYKIITKE